MPTQDKRLLIASNRLPVALKRKGDDWEIRPGSGGLVSALAPVLRHRGGMWVGWPGAPGEIPLDRLLEESDFEIGYTLKSVNLTREEIELYYEGFCNEILWPLAHDFHDICHFAPTYWRAYQGVNEKFAAKLAESLRTNDYLWVHDYHLMLCAHYLREAGIKSNIGYFLHTPFPSIDVYLKLPWRFQILRGLLEYDLLGFHTVHDRKNFITCLRRLLPGVRVRGAGPTRLVRWEEREIRVGVFPISIDYDGLTRQTASDETVSEIERLQDIHRDRQIILGVDRLDYTKGIPNRIRAFGDALRRRSDLREQVTYIQVVVPSREHIPEYQQLKREIDGLVGEINGEFTTSDWVPIHYIYRSLEPRKLFAYYRAAAIGLVTPLRDGMNLVAKEYCASKLGDDGVLILSEFAGAAAQLHDGALMVNPYDIEGVADAIYEAFEMGSEERTERMEKLRRRVRRSDIFWWVDAFLDTAIAKSLSDFPRISDKVPQEYTPNELRGSAFQPYL